MPSVSVPLKGEKGWDTLCKQRRDFWAKGKNDILTAHFKASEFWCHDATPVPIVARAGLIRLCEDFLEPMREKFGTALVLSGYRHELYNAKIGGARHSQHIYENDFESVAADMRFERGTPNRWAAEARKLRTKNTGGKGGIGTYVRSNFVHLDNRNYSANWSG
jgi:hypothetical protein